MAKSKIRIPAHVFVYSIALIPAFIGISYYNAYKPDDEKMEEGLRKEFSSDIDRNRAKREDITKFLQAVKRGDIDSKLEEVLRGGKGQMHKYDSVDKSSYETEKNELVNDQTKEPKEKKVKMLKVDRANSVETKSFGNALSNNQVVNQRAYNSDSATDSSNSVSTSAGPLLLGSMVVLALVMIRPRSQ